jgi:hypothetical protein
MSGTSVGWWLVRAPLVLGQLAISERGGRAGQPDEDQEPATTTAGTAAEERHRPMVGAGPGRPDSW